MGIQIIGEEVPVRYDAALVFDRKGAYIFRKIEVKTETQIKNPSNWALVVNGKLHNLEARYAISMKQSLNGKDFYICNEKADEKELFFPSARIFIPHYVQINKALRRESAAYDASGNILTERKLQTYANRLNHNCHIWLNDKFKKGDGEFGLDIISAVGFSNGKIIMAREPLEGCLEKECWADLESVNRQGLPTKKSPIKGYEPGKSVYFSRPEGNYVARFIAYSDRADLSCGRGPTYSDARLGVFLCAKISEEK
ncbi:hypothetical protein J4461_02915 [Candidatus Pacearchaeota archaeon]|nr:hypothetical protein [Candidatus Pacearchaeota archaeon]